MIRRTETIRRRGLIHPVCRPAKRRYQNQFNRPAALLWGLLGAVVALAAPSAADAAGAIITRSNPSFTITVSTEWLDTGGYRPVFFDIVPTTPPTGDRTIHVEFKARELRFVQRELLVSEDIEIPAGSVRVLATLSVPQVHPWQYCDLEVWVDGRYEKKLSQQAVMVNNSWAGWQESSPNVVAVIDATAIAPAQSVLLPNPDATELVRVLPTDAQNQFGVAGGAFTMPGSTVATPAATTMLPMPSLISVRHDRLPTRWVDYSGIDMVFIPFQTIERLAASEPARWRAIRDWTAAGGNLIVSGAGDDFANLAALDKHLRGGDRKRANDGEFASRGAPASKVSEWHDPALANHTPGLNDPANSNSGVATIYSTDAAGQVTTQVVSNTPLPPPEKMPFRLRTLGSGMVVAASVPDLFQQKSADWAWMLNSLTSDRWLWFRRNGLSLERSNPEYWDWLVQGVGLAPVTEFRVLITLFVLAIGPINYFWLRRRQKLHLLVIFVPVAALAVTGTLFAYALFSDGLAVRVRARSLTLLDQREGQAVCWSRLSYYAGLSPSGGLRFPADMAVYPLWSNDDDSGGPGRQETIWTPDRQELVAGWIASRTPTQFVTARTRASEAAVVYLGKRGAGETWIENRLATRIERLLLADDAGQLYRAADIAPGERKALSPTTNREDEAEIWRMVRERRPAAPADFVDRDISGFSYRRRMMYYPQMNNQMSQPSLESGRLEAGLRAAVTGSEGQSIYNLPPNYSPQQRSYVAIVERSPEVDYGVSEPREEDSLHVVVGKW